MEFLIGEKVLLKSKAKSFRGEIRTIESDGVHVLLELPQGDLKIGDSLTLIIERPDYYNEFNTSISDIKDKILQLKWYWPDRREFFRIDDIISISAKKICPSYRGSSKIIYGSMVQPSETSQDAPSIDPQLWRLLNDINTKLNLILERLNLLDQATPKMEAQKVNISAGGIRFISDEAVQKGDIMEVRMHLPTCPPLNIITYGEVVRALKKNDKYEIALSFRETEDEVREAILRYTLQKQREQLRKSR